MSVVIDNAKLDRASRAKHIAIALEDGPKAGLRSYMDSVGHNREYDALNASRRFDRYCAEWGPYLEVLDAVDVEVAPKVSKPKVSEIELLRAEIAELRSELRGSKNVVKAVAKTRTTPVKPKAQPKATVKGAGRESRFTTKVVAALDLPTKRNATFVWKGKRGKSTWKVLSSSKTGIVATRIA